MITSTAPRRLAIIGGGISGLSAAWEAHKRGFETVLFEASDRVGGVLRTDLRNGFLFECGPDSLLSRKPSALRLARELGVPLVPAEAAGPPGVVRAGKIHPLPDGFRMLAPTKLMPFLATGLLSPKAKLRAAFELLLPRGPERDDETVGAFVRRRFGHEIADRIAQPLIGGIYATDIDRLSLQATLPFLAQLESRHRSVTLGLIRQSLSSASGEPEGPMFVAPEFGMQQFVDALARRLPNLRRKTGVLELEPPSDVPGWTVVTADSSARFDAVVLAAPLPVLAKLLRFDPVLADGFSALKATRTATVGLGFHRNALRLPLNGSGFVVPRLERFRMTACTYSHRKYAGRAPEGSLLLRCHFGHSEDPQTPQLRDEELRTLALGELDRLLGLRMEPIETVVVRHHQALPVLELGHRSKLDQLQSRAASYPGLGLAGNALNGVGISDCIDRAQETVERLDRSAPVLAG